MGANLGKAALGLGGFAALTYTNTVNLSGLIVPGYNEIEPVKELIDIQPGKNPNGKEEILLAPGRRPNQLPPNQTIEEAIKAEAKVITKLVGDGPKISAYPGAYLFLPEDKANKYTNLSSAVEGLFGEPFRSLSARGRNPKEAQKIAEVIFQKVIKEEKDLTIIAHSFPARDIVEAVLKIKPSLDSEGKGENLKVVFIAPAFFPEQRKAMEKALGKNFQEYTSPNDSIQEFSNGGWIIKFKGREKRFKEEYKNDLNFKEGTDFYHRLKTYGKDQNTVKALQTVGAIK